MFCKDKETGKRYFNHCWHRKPLKWAYKKSNCKLAPREMIGIYQKDFCFRCGKEETKIKSLDSYYTMTLDGITDSIFIEEGENGK